MLIYRAGWVTYQYAASRSVLKQSTLLQLITLSMSFPSRKDKYSRTTPILSSLYLTRVYIMHPSKSYFYTVTDLLLLPHPHSPSILSPISSTKLLRNYFKFAVISSKVRLFIRADKLFFVFLKIYFCE